MKIIQPRKVVAIRFNDEVIDEKRIWTVLGMLSSWTVLVTASILAFSLLEPSLDMTDVLSVSLSLLGNTGPALGAFDPTATWATRRTVFDSGVVVDVAWEARVAYRLGFVAPKDMDALTSRMSQV